MPAIQPADNLADALLTCLHKTGLELRQGDIICVASKIVTISENRFVELNTVVPSKQAYELHAKIPRKKPTILELILQECDYDLKNIDIHGNWIGVKTKTGRKLTSAGIDTVDDNTVLLLPRDPNASAKKIRINIKNSANIDVAILITDSDGREDIGGATQLCIGLSGMQPLRDQQSNEETICDMLAAAAGLVMGQRGNNIPAAIIRGHEFELDEKASLTDATL